MKKQRGIFQNFKKVVEDPNYPVDQVADFCRFFEGLDIPVSDEMKQLLTEHRPAVAQGLGLATKR